MGCPGTRTAETTRRRSAIPLLSIAPSQVMTVLVRVAGRCRVTRSWALSASGSAGPWACVRDGGEDGPHRVWSVAP